MTRCNGRANHCFNGGEQHRLQKRTASLANLQLRSKFGSWIDGKERIRKQQSLRIDVNVSHLAGAVAGERAGLDTDHSQHSAAVQPALHAYSETVRAVLTSAAGVGGLQRGMRASSAETQ